MAGWPASMVKMSKRDIIYLIIIVVLLFLGWAFYTKAQDLKNTVDNQRAVADTLTKTVDKLGRETAQKDAVIIAKEKDLKELRGISKEFDKAIRDAKKAKGRIQYLLSLKTTTQATVKPEVIIDTVFGKPIAQAVVITYTDEWIDVRYDDSLSVLVRNAYTFTQTHRNPIFKKASTTVQVTNLNPYTRTDELLSIDVRPPQKRTHFGPYLGVGLTSEGNLQPQLGVGLGYSLIPIK